MAKMRVRDFAKEINIEPKEIVNMLKGTAYEVSTSANNLEEAGQKYIRNHMTGEAKMESAKAEKPVENKQTEAERPKKKSSISAVFNPQNSKQMNGGRRQGYHTNQNSHNAAKQQGNRPLQSASPAESNPAQQAGQTENHVERQEEKPVVQQEVKAPERPIVNAQMVQERIAAQARANEANRAQQQNNRYQGDRNNNRPQGDRPYGNRSQGDRNNNRPQGDRPYGNRPQGDRPYGNRPQGDRPYGNRPQGNRSGENQGERGQRSGNYDRNNSRNYQNSRQGAPYGQGGQGNRGGNSNYTREPGKRLDQEINRFNKDSVKATPEEIRTKESRENRDRDVKKSKNQDHDKLGSKRQERYVNLEKNGGKKRPQVQPSQPKEEDTIRTIILPEHMTIKELADKMKVQASAIVKKLFLKGQMVTVNQDVNYESAEEIALEFNCIAEPEVKIDVIAELLKEEDDEASTLVARPPVVCVMGHVDHGKTSLLDAIRNTHVTDREAGGITQHIGAYVVGINGQKITFLDTPGHEAFTAMRMRGAKATDIAILVVAADDGVMPQTIEAINHAKAAGIEIIVAINKIDKPNANIDRVKQELSEYELIPEDWGGSTIFVPVSAHTHEGIDSLLEMILLTAEVLELKANPERQARGVIIEAQLDKGRGAVATALVQKGTLKIGDPIACGSAYGKVRAMIDDKGRRVKEAGPSVPVEILGLSSVPDAGETFVACQTEKDARSFAETYISEGKEKLLEETRSRMSLDDLFSQIKSGNVKELDIIVKADVQGSVEAVKQSLVKLSNEEVVVKIIHGGVGAINESDVILASASNAIIIGFNVRPDPTAKTTAENEGVDVRLYKVIYNAIEDVEAAMKGMLDPIFEEKVIGHAEVRQIFKASGIGNIAGSYVLDGTFERGCKVRISREGKLIFEGALASLKRFKDDVKEVKSGYECGLVFEGYNEIQELDQVEAYKMVEVAR